MKLKSLLLIALIGVFSLGISSLAFGEDVVIDQLPGWPIEVIGHPGFSNMGGLVLADIDADADLEILVATTGQTLHAWDYDGTEIFSVTLAALAQTPVAVGNVLGDDAPEIIVTTRDLSGGNPTPTLQIFSGDGELLESSPMPALGSMGSSVTLVNLDSDNYLEMLIPERGDRDGWLHALNGDLTSVGGSWPVLLDHVPATSAAAGDLDGDGEVEIAICSFESIYAIDAAGNVLPGFPVKFPGETYSYSSPALADLDGDGLHEIITTSHGDFNRLHAISVDGTELAGWPFDLGDAWSFSAPSVGDIDGNGDLEVVVGRAGGMIVDAALFVVNHDGTDFPGFPYMMEGGSEGNFALADFTGDARLEIVFTNNLFDGEYGYLLAVDADGQLLPGWPLRPHGLTFLSGPSIADVNGDGIVEFGALSVYNGSTVTVNLYSYDGYSIGEGGIAWKTYQADNQHTGLYRSPDEQDDDDDDADDDDDDDSQSPSDSDDDDDEDEACCG